MKHTKNTVISIYGQHAVDIAYNFQGGYCYRGIYDHGKRIAQLEVVIDKPGKCNGFDQKWVDVTLDPWNFEKVIKQLKRLGFSECFALVYGENDYGYKTTNEVFIQI